MQAEIPRDKFEGFVLAGGKSSRMGTAKAFLKIENKTFIQRAVEALTFVCKERVKIVLNSNQSDADFSSFNSLRDIFEERGAAGGIHAALSNSKSEWAIILACDLPLVTGETIKDLSEIALDLSPNIAAAVPKETGGNIQPLCALYRKELCLPLLTQLLETRNSVSLRDFLALIPAFYIDVKKIPSANETVFFNVNQPTDYEFVLKKRVSNLV